MTDAVPRQNEPSLEQEQQGSGNLTSSNHLGHHCPQAHPIGLAAVQTHRQTSAEQTRQRELEILEELKRLGKSCQSDVKPSISAVRATLEEIARKLMMAHYKGASTEAARAMHILKKREKAKEELEEKKKKIESDVKLSIIDTKFSTQVESVEAQLKSSTVGLVTLDQMRQKQESAIKEREKQLAQKLDSESSTLKLRIEKQEKDGESSRTTKSLSFYDDDDDDDEDDDDKDKDDENKCDNSSDRRPDSNGNDDDANSNHSNGSRKKRAKIAVAWDNLGVDTSYLPDREREEEERKFREKLATEWRESQQRLKGEEIEITFSYWDGSGHRRQVRMKKGDSIYQFLQACLDTLRKDFNELRSVSADQLMYVKEDLIIPHRYTFYDFIVTKARGKSGPLFMFDVHEDVRLTADATVEKDESHAGKVIMRSWHERNKHIFPASRWESYDPTKSYDKYTISDKRSR